MFVFLINWQ